MNLDPKKPKKIAEQNSPTTKNTENKNGLVWGLNYFPKGCVLLILDYASKQE